MARADLAVVRRMIYDNLGLTNQSSGYGNLAANERYLSGYIDDAIAYADIMTSTILLKNKQEHLMMEASAEATGNSPVSLNNRWHILKVEYYTSNLMDERRRGDEIDYDEWERINDDFASIYDAELSKGHYAIQDSKVYMIPSETYSGNTVVVTYIDLTHPSSLSALKSPTGFESAIAMLASSLLLMKRLDKPEQAMFYKTSYSEFMQNYMMEDSNMPDLVDTP